MRWYIVKYLPIWTDYVLGGEVHCAESNGKWIASGPGLGKGKPANHILVSIANLLDANHAECIALQEIDRAGNAIDA